MKLLLFTCTGSLSVDQQSNEVSLFNVIEQITAASMPCVLPDFRVVAIVRREPGEPDPTLRLSVAMDGYTLLNAPFRLNFGDALVARGLGDITGLAIPRAGVLTFTLRRDNENWGEWIVDVTAPRPPERADTYTPAETAPPATHARVLN